MLRLSYEQFRIGTVIARSEATKQSILPLRGENGLLRFARNDGVVAALLAMTSNFKYGSAFSRRECARGFASIVRASRTEGAGNAGCPMHPQPRVQMKKAHEHSHHGHTGNHPAFPAQWFYGLLRALPGDQACLTPSPALLLADLTPARGVRTTRLRRTWQAAFVSRAAASTASRPTSVTCARPS